MLWRRELHELAADAQDRDTVAQLDRLVDVVGDEDDRLSSPPDAEELLLSSL
jgi:hypothetical protein